MNLIYLFIALGATILGSIFGGLIGEKLVKFILTLVQPTTVTVIQKLCTSYNTNSCIHIHE